MDTPPNPTAAPPQPLKRAGVQIHLSTSIALMLVAGLLIWANLSHAKQKVNAFAVGWPLVFYYPRPRSTESFHLLHAIFDAVLWFLMLTPVVFVSKPGIGAGAAGRFLSGSLSARRLACRSSTASILFSNPSASISAGEAPQANCFVDFPTRRNLDAFRVEQPTTDPVPLS